MKASTLVGVVGVAVVGVIIGFGSALAGPKPKPPLEWLTVVNNNDVMPGAPSGRTFNSYNQPSVNLDGVVVFRARSRGGTGQGQPTHGIYTRDMFAEGPITRILDRSTLVPHPNNLDTRFVETPSFPRIDMESDMIATRGNHQPVWRYHLDDGSETKGGNTGIYTNAFGELLTATSRLGHVKGLSFFEVPEPGHPGTPFEVFPGAPAVTNGRTVVFKGNYTLDQIGRTGVYYRHLDSQSAGGGSPVVLIANNRETLIPGTDTLFGSTSPPSAAQGQVVFSGFDNEEDQSLGGIYLAPLQPEPPLSALVSIGERIPGEAASETFNRLGEGGAFDGRFVGFWGSWGNETKSVRLYCAEEGNKDRIAYCNQNLVCRDTDETLGDPNSICETDPIHGIICYQDKEVPVNQGFFVHDTKTRKTWVVAKTGEQFDDFLFWNYSGMTPCSGRGHSVEGAEDSGEPVRWRSSAFIAASGRGATFKAAFKARTGNFTDGVYVNAVDGIYLAKWPGKSQAVDIETVLDTTMDGRLLDAEAPENSTIIELGLEREGLRGQWLAVNVSMGIEGGTEEDGLSGIYLTELP